MKKNILNTAAKSLKAGSIALLAGFALVSCTIQTGGYSETDGVYYDPSRDTLPETTQETRGNRIGEYYDYQDSAYAKSRQYGRYGSGRYKNWDDDASASDWGTYAGTVTSYNGWGSPYGFYSPFSFYRPYGFGSYFGLGYGFGNPWLSYGFGSPFFYDGFYSPFYGNYYSYYNPYFYGYNPYGYGGYYSPYHYGYGRTAPRRSSGPDGFYNGSGRASAPNGFRTASPNRNQNQVYQQRRMPSGERSIYRPQNTDTYRNNSSEGYRNNGGFRSGGMDSGSMRSGSYNSGGSVRSSGGFRTGGR